MRMRSVPPNPTLYHGQLCSMWIAPQLQKKAESLSALRTAGGPGRCPLLAWTTERGRSPGCGASRSGAGEPCSPPGTSVAHAWTSASRDPPDSSPPALRRTDSCCLSQFLFLGERVALFRTFANLFQRLVWSEAASLTRLHDRRQMAPTLGRVALFWFESPPPGGFMKGGGERERGRTPWPYQSCTCPSAARAATTGPSHTRFLLP